MLPSVTEPRASVEHLILTRFNVRARFGAGPGRDALSDAWLRERFELFERWCLPTIRAQTRQDFEWRMLCDEETPPAVLERLRAYGANIAPMTVPRRDQERKPWPWKEVVRDVEPGTDVLVTSRLDSDDGLHPRFIERTREHLEHFLASGHGRMVHAFPRGYRHDARTGKTYAVAAANGPCLTLFERVGDVTPVTVMEKNHRKMPTRYPTVEDESLRAFVQVIHGENVTNEIGRRDRRVRRSRLLRDFPALDVG